jgi:TrmH family RNA methyltransferase
MASLSKREIKDIRSLHTKKGRRANKLFLAEGVRLIEQAHRLRAPFEQVIYHPESLGPRGLELISRLGRSRLALREVRRRDLEAISGTTTTPGIIGVCPLPELDPSELCRRRHRKLLLCDGVADPGNLGTLMRSALAFGFTGMLLCGACADGYSPKVVRSSAGAIFGLKTARGDALEAVDLADKYGLKIVASDLKGKSLSDADIGRLESSRIMLAVGSEAEGVSPGILAKARWRWRLKQTSQVESLNAAVAGSILMNRIFLASRG